MRSSVEIGRGEEDVCEVCVCSGVPGEGEKVASGQKRDEFALCCSDSRDG